MRARAGAAFLTWAAAGCCPTARAAWRFCNMITWIKTGTGAALRKRRRRTTMTRKLSRSSPRSDCNICSTAVGACRRNCLTPSATSRERMSGGNIASHNWSGLGDIRIQGIYTGFSRGHVRRCDVRLEIADGQLHRRHGLGGSRHANRQRQHGPFARRILSRQYGRRMKNGTGSRRRYWICRR